ncbi:TPA: hypothetical protein O8U71_004857, partial [Escherichia coli]|nr:hypothetical protein [Escherichia coli]
MKCVRCLQLPDRRASWSSDLLPGGIPGFRNPSLTDPAVILPSVGQGGDSGSPVLAYNDKKKQWGLLGVLSYASGNAIYWSELPMSSIKKIIDSDSDGTLVYRNNGPIQWSFNSVTGKGILIQDDDVKEMTGTVNKNSATGKNLTFEGDNGLLQLLNSVNHGAGTLTFRNNYTVFTNNDSSWIGGGIDVSAGNDVIWKINGEKGDNLHKIGAGTLIVNGSGINEGGLKVGDGVVRLEQRSDSTGSKQAFSSINISSGRATVVLSDPEQVNPDSISWGYRGGIVDLNGADLTFHKLNAADYGAVLANNAENTSTITLDYVLDKENIPIHNWESRTSRGNEGDLYVYNNNYTKTTDYFILTTTGSYGYYPTRQTSNATWKYIGHDEDAAKMQVADNINSSGYIYHGQFSGNLNIINRVDKSVKGAFVLDGSANISGSFTQENARLTLQGHPVIHAYNSQGVSDKISSTGDNSVLTAPTSFGQTDWERRNFQFDSLILKNTDFGLGRNATLKTSVIAEKSSVTLGDSRIFIDNN